MLRQEAHFRSVQSLDRKFRQSRRAVDRDFLVPPRQGIRCSTRPWPQPLSTGRPPQIAQRIGVWSERRQQYKRLRPGRLQNPMFLVPPAGNPDQNSVATAIASRSDFPPELGSADFRGCCSARVVRPEPSKGGRFSLPDLKPTTCANVSTAMCTPRSRSISCAPVVSLGNHVV